MSQWGGEKVVCIPVLWCWLAVGLLIGFTGTFILGATGHDFWRDWL